MRFPVIIFGTSLLLGACSGGYERAAAPPAVGARVEIAANSTGVLTSLGDTRELTARVLTADGQVIATPQISWKSSRPDVATVTGTDDGVSITAVGNGTALITATSGSVQSTVGVSVRQAIGSVLISSPASTLAAGNTMQLTAVAMDARGHSIPAITSFTFSSSDSRLVLVEPDGKVTAILTNGGESIATITAAVTRDGVTTTGTTTVRVSI